MIHATHHILNNLLNQMQLFKIEASRSKDFNQDILKSYDIIVNQAIDLVNRLSSIENINDKNIWASVDPQNIGVSSNDQG